jgi:hypothetical protein
MPAKLTFLIPNLNARLDRAAAVLVHRAADSHVVIAKELAPKVSGFLERHINKVPEGVLTKDVVVISGARYSLWVEQGTTKMAARPFFEPAFWSSVRQLKREATIVVEAVLLGRAITALKPSNKVIRLNPEELEDEI